VRIDLHAHSNVSDGTEPPRELVRLAAAAQLDVVAITDHDTVSGWDEAAAAALDFGIRVVPGLELSCTRGAASVHDALRDPLAVEMGELLDEVIVLQGRGAARADGPLVLVVVDRVTLTVGENRPVA
jgi:predicted metal-dependent phosphoesterase TrpH